MKEFNASYTDGEIRELLRSRLLTHDTEDTFTTELFNMETRLAFADVPFIAPSLQKEKELLNNLQQHFGGFTHMKWLFTGIATTAVVSAALVFQNKTIQPQAVTAPVTIHHSAPEKQDIPLAGPLQDSAVPFQNYVQPRLTEATVSAPMTDEPAGLFPGFIENGYPAPPVQKDDDTLPKQKTYASGDLRNLTNEDHKLKVDTFFNGIKKLEVNGTFPNINVVAVSGDQTRLKGEMNLEMKGIYVKRSDYRIRYERLGNTLKIWLENRGRNNTLVMGTLYYNGFLNFEVPAETELVLKNRSGNIAIKGIHSSDCLLETDYGNIEAEQMEGDMEIKSLSGNLDLDNIKGDIKAAITFGHVELSNIKGEIQMKNTSGNITADHLEGNMEFTALFGHIDMKQMSGNLKINSTSGNIDLTAIRSDMLDVNASFGHVKMSDVISDIRIISKSGDVTLSNIKGAVSVNSNYGHQSFSDIRGNIRTSSASGDISIRNADGNLNINSVYGNINLQDCNSKIHIDVRSGDVSGKNIVCVDSLFIKSNYGNIRMNLSNKLEELSFDLYSTTGTMAIKKEDVELKKENGSLFLKKGPIVIKAVSSSGDQLFN